MQDDDKDKIDKLRDLLYSPHSPNKINAHRRKLGTQEYGVQDDWKKESENDGGDVAVQSSPLLQQKKGKSVTLLVVFSLLFFLVCAGIAAFVFFSGFNTISPSKVDITFNAPISAPAGEPVMVNMSISNNNSEDLTLTDAIINYPDGSRQPQDVAQPLVQDLQSIGTIPSGQSVNRSFEFTPFGDENTVKDVQVTLQYHIPNSNAVFEKKKTYELSLSASPVTVTVNALKEINSSQEYDLTIHMVSNSVVLLKNLLVAVKYPFGFSYKGSDPSPVSSSFINLWSIGDLQPGGQRDITVKGIITGDNADQRVFNVSLGVADKENSQKIGTVFLTKAQTVNISQPFLASAIVLDGDSSPTHAAVIGRGVAGSIQWRNNLSTVVNDANLVLNLDGTLLDKSKIYSSSGFYDSQANTITWNKLTDPDLANIPAGGSGQVTFGFSTDTDSPEIDATAHDSTVNLNLNVSATRLSEANVPQSITSSNKKTVQISSIMNFTAHDYYSVSPFKNTGPIPPKVGQQTTYTITWTLANSFNDIDNATIQATLPIYVKWLGTISPTTEQVTYNPNTQTVVWNVGNLQHSTGYGSTTARQLSFQIGITPSLSQNEATPVLVNNMSAQGTDLFTHQQISTTVQRLDINLTGDPAYTYGANTVTQ